MGKQPKNSPLVTVTLPYGVDVQVVRPDGKVLYDSTLSNNEQTMGDDDSSNPQGPPPPPSGGNGG